jgi:hypothetical protein
MLSIKRDSWLALIVCSVTGIFIFMNTGGYPTSKAQGFGGGPAFYPQVLAGLLIGLGLLVAIQDALQGRPGSTRPQSGSGRREVTYGRVAVLMLLCVFSVLAMKYAGFVLSGFFLIFLSALLIKSPAGVRQIALYLLYSLGMIALVYVVFELFVGVQLPSASSYVR